MHYVRRDIELGLGFGWGSWWVMMKWRWLLRMTLPGPRELNGFPEGPPSLAHRASVSHEEVVKRATLWFRLVWISRGMQVVTSPVGLADFCLNQADRRDSAAASFWTVRLLGGLPGFLWCATNAAAICGHIVAHSGVRYSTQDKLFQPCCHPRLWASVPMCLRQQMLTLHFLEFSQTFCTNQVRTKAKWMSFAQHKYICLTSKYSIKL